MEVTPAHCYACFDALLAALDGEIESAVPRRVRAFPDAAAGGLFVTWTRSADSCLRGCIGSLSPLSLASGLPEYAVLSARDRRFAPITRLEVAGLECSVSVLHSFERALGGWEDWCVEPKVARCKYLRRALTLRSAPLRFASL